MRTENPRNRRDPLLLLLVAFACAGCSGGGSAPVTGAVTPIQILNSSLIPANTRLALRNNIVPTERRYNLFIVTASGVTPLTSGFFNAKDPAWSPDGTRLAFRGNLNGSGEEVWVINVDGTGLRQLTLPPLNKGYPAWSPDGTRIAFSVDNAADTDNTIWLMNADGSNQRRISTMGVFGGISWSPDSSRITWGCPDPDPEGGIRIINADGTGERRLTTSVGDLGPRWSPDGLQIVLDFSTTVSIMQPDRPDQIFVINADGTNRRQITNGAPGNHLAFWSRDNRIWFASKRNGSTYQVFVMNPDGNGLQQVTTSGAGDVDQPVWSPWP